MPRSGSPARKRAIRSVRAQSIINPMMATGPTRSNIRPTSQDLAKGCRCSPWLCGPGPHGRGHGGLGVMRRFRRLVVISCALGALFVPSAARADDLVLNWPEVLPGLTDAYDPDSGNQCSSGRIQCVDSVIKEMTRRIKPQAAGCDHNAMFSLLYLRVTTTYRGQVGAPGDFFSDEAFVNHEDAVFASYFFGAMDDYRNGRRDRVPAAWQIALDAARDHAVSGLGNLLLGVNAHVNRDLPYVLAAIGLVKPA